MKKHLNFISFLSVMVFTLVCLLPVRVDAAYAYVWTVNGEDLRRGSTNKAGNVSWQEDSNYNGGVLTLNNYNGGQLKIDCHGTGLGHVFAIKLVGENTIKVDKGVGILANAPVIFIGDGKLTIEASVPIGSSSILNNDSTLTNIENAKFSTNTVLIIEPKVSATCEPCAKINDTDDQTNVTVKEDTKEQVTEVVGKDETDKDTKDESDNKQEVEEENHKLFNILVAVYCVLSLVVIIVLFLKLKKKKLVK